MIRRNFKNRECLRNNDVIELFSNVSYFFLYFIIADAEKGIQGLYDNRRK